MVRKLILAVVVAALVPLLGCGSKEEASKEAGETAQKETGAEVSSEEPQYITVQHILIGFQGSVPGKPITRTKEEAATLAQDVLKRAQAGEDFDKLVVEYTNDSPPGIYKMANHGATADMAQQIHERGRMVPAFGDVGFPLEVGEIGMAEFSQETSPYGWHIIKRVE